MIQINTWQLTIRQLYFTCVHILKTNTFESVPIQFILYRYTSISYEMARYKSCIHVSHTVYIYLLQVLVKRIKYKFQNGFCFYWLGYWFLLMEPSSNSNKPKRMFLFQKMFQCLVSWLHTRKRSQ